MSVEISIKVIKDTATPALRRLAKQLDPHYLGTRIAPPLARHWRNHLAGLPKNKQGYPSTGFWEDAARRVQGIATREGALLSCDKLGVRQRYYGGSIEAINHNNLTIPICAEAYGTTVADWGFENLTLVVFDDGRKFLALWLGTDEVVRSYREAGFGKAARRAEVTTRRAQKLNASLSSQEKPKVMFFKSGGSGSISRTERHVNLKFLFKLQPSTAPQLPNPNVIPPDLMDKAKEEILKVVSQSV